MNIVKKRRIQISPDILASFLTSPTPPGVTSDAPPDLKIISAKWNDERIELLVTSSSFTNPADGEEPPPLMEIHFQIDQRHVSID